MATKLEIFNAAGYQDGARFFNNMEGGGDPRLGILQQRIDQLTKMIETKQVEENSRNARMQELQDKKSQTQIVLQNKKTETEMMKQGLSNIGARQVAAMDNSAMLHHSMLTRKNEPEVGY